MLHELFITHCTNGTSIMNTFTYLTISVKECVYVQSFICIDGSIMDMFPPSLVVAICVLY